MKFMKMISSAANYISSTVSEGSHIGIVEFESGATVLHYLIEVYSDDHRNSLLGALPVSAGGSTGIGAGLLLGLEVSTVLSILSMTHFQMNNKQNYFLKRHLLIVLITMTSKNYNVLKIKSLISCQTIRTAFILRPFSTRF